MEATTSPALEARNVWRWLPLGREQVEILRSVSFSVHRGEFVALLGTQGDPVEEALGVAVKIAKAFGLQAVGDHAEEQMPGQMVGGLAAEH